jgi:Tol biopolymer transport system component
MLDSGKRIAHYEIVSLLGAGGMGEVYRARDTRLGRLVALKVLPPDVAGDTGRRQRFEFEARAASGLNHPSIVSVFDTGEVDGLAYIVTELVDGEVLRDTIKRGPMPPSRVADLAAQVAEALAAAHAAGVIHRDLKPENIMITRDGRAKILDFGLAKQVTPPPTNSDETALLTRTSPGTVMGTAAYMSPEQIKGESIDNRSDIFSLGIVLHECLTGRQPFERTTAVEMMTAILREDPPELPETAPPALRLIVTHCLEKEPDRRFQSARDLAFALRTVISGGRSSGAQAAIAAATGAATHRRRWLWPSLAGLLGVLLALLAIPHVLELEPIELANYRLTPFATDDRSQSGGAWSPDGKSIAYLRTCGGVPQLMVRALESGTPVQLTRSEEPITQVFWAPDASLLYYVSAANQGELWGISPAGGTATLILANVASASISPDGRTLAVWRITDARGGSHGSVWTSTPPGAAPAEYQPALPSGPIPSAEDRVSFSPDGSALLLLTGHDGAQLWLLPFPPGHGQPKRLLRHTPLGLAPNAAWLPDNRHAVLAFGPGLPPRHALWLVDLKRERLRRLTAGTSGQGYPSTSPDGRRLVFAALQEDYNLVKLPVDGSAPGPLVANSRNELSPSWAADGEQLIYSTDRSGTREIWIHNLRAEIEREAVTDKDFPPDTTVGLADPVFSPDGSRFAFVRYSYNEPATIWIASTAGGAPVRLTKEHIHSPTWSPDGNWVAGLMHRDSPWQPAIVGVGADMSAHAIPGAPACRTAPDWSPTGEWLACGTASGIALFSRDGARSKMLPNIRCLALGFSHDGRTLFLVGREHGRSFLRSVDVAAGTLRNIADYGPELTISGGRQFDTRLSVAPDGKSLATSVVTSKSELWLLEGYPLPHPWWDLRRFLPGFGV